MEFCIMHFKTDVKFAKLLQKLNFLLSKTSWG